MFAHLRRTESLHLETQTSFVSLNVSLVSSGEAQASVWVKVRADLYHHRCH